MSRDRVLRSLSTREEDDESRPCLVARYTKGGAVVEVSLRGIADGLRAVSLKVVRCDIDSLNDLAAILISAQSSMLAWLRLGIAPSERPRPRKDL